MGIVQSSPVSFARRDPKTLEIEKRVPHIVRRPILIASSWALVTVVYGSVAMGISIVTQGEVRERRENMRILADYGYPSSRAALIEFIFGTQIAFTALVSYLGQNEASRD
jgi:hypothetical protein